MPVHLRDRVECVLVPAADISRRIDELADEICTAYAGTQRLVMLVILTGAFVFAADLARAGGPEIVFRFVRTSTYGTGMKGADEEERSVSVSHLPHNLLGHDVLLVDDLIDQGFTLERLRAVLTAAGARSLRFCTLLSKRLHGASQRVQRLRQELPVDFIGFDVPDRWVAGYGIDAGGDDLRSHPHVVAVNRQFYSIKGHPDAG